MTHANRKQIRRNTAQQGAVQFRRKALAVAMAMALAPAVASAQSPWNVEIFGGAHEDNAGGGAIGVLPFGGDVQKGSFIGELRASTSEEANYEVGAAVGYRSLSALSGWLVGAYGAYDYKESDSDNTFGRATAGVEAFSQNFDFRANYYWSNNDAERTGLGAGRFNRFALYRNGIYEDPMGGWDAEVGGLIPISNVVETRAYVGAYGIEGDIVDSDTGWRVRAEVFPMKNLSLNVGYQDDDVFGDQWFAQVRYAFGQSSTQGIRTVEERMIDPFRRERILTVENVESTRLSDAVVINPNVRHVSATAAPGGDGSFESPFQTFADLDASGAVPNLIYTHAGDYALLGPLALQPGQTLWGQGLSLYGIGGDAYPMIMGAEPTAENPYPIGIQLADNTTVAGIGITAYDHAIYGENVQGNINILSNKITSLNGAAISFWNIAEDASLASNITISGNAITAHGAGYYYSGNGAMAAAAYSYGSGVGIELVNFAGNGQTISQTADINNNTILADSDGVYLLGYAYGSGSSLSQSINIANNTIRSGNESGIDFEAAGALDGAAANLVATITNNQITAAESGFENDYFFAVGAGSTATRNVTISSNTINAGDEGINFGEASYGYYYGIRPGTTALEGGVINDTITITNNTITASSDGIAFHNIIADGPGSAVTQRINISGNNIVADADYCYYGCNGSGIAFGSGGEDYYYGEDFYGYGRSGIAALSGGKISQDIRIENNTIQAYNAGVYFASNLADGGAEETGASTLTQNIAINGNTISANIAGITFGGGYYYYGYNPANLALDGGQLAQTVSIGGNDITTAGAGVLFFGNVAVGDSPGGGAMLTQDITVSGNTIASGGYSYYSYGSGGVSVVNNYAGEDSTLAQTLTVEDNVITSLWGDGVSVYDSESDGGGTLTQGISVNRNTIDSNYSGISITNTRADEDSATTQSVAIQDNTVTTLYGDSVRVSGVYAYGSGASLTQDLTISGNVIRSADGFGIRVGSVRAEEEGATLTQTVTVTGNAVTSGSVGIGVIDGASAVDGGVLSTTVDISGNTIDSRGGEGGIWASGWAYDDGVLTQQYTISGNTVNTVSADGVEINNDAWSGGTATQTVTLSGNTFTVVDDDGIDLENDDWDGGTATQVVSITGNTITVVGDDQGIDADELADDGQDLTITGNSITALTGIVLDSDDPNVPSIGIPAKISGNTFATLPGQQVVLQGAATCTGTDCPAP